MLTQIAVRPDAIRAIALSRTARPERRAFGGASEAEIARSDDAAHGRHDILRAQHRNFWRG